MCNVCVQIVNFLNSQIEFDSETIDSVVEILTEAGHDILDIDEKEDENE